MSSKYTKGAIAKYFNNREVSFQEFIDYFEASNGNWIGGLKEYSEVLPKNIELTMVSDNSKGYVKLDTGDNNGGMGYNSPRFIITNLQSVYPLKEVYNVK